MTGKRSLVVSVAFLLAILVIVPAGVGSGQQEEAAFVVVVNNANPVSSLSTSELSKLFMKRMSTWIDGRPAEPVDLPAESPVREEFSQVVHGKSALAIAAYWRHQIFAGRGAPPAQRETEVEVLELVRRNVNAVGYVSAGATLDGSVKVLALSP